MKPSVLYFFCSRAVWKPNRVQILGFSITWTCSGKQGIAAKSNVNIGIITSTLGCTWSRCSIILKRFKTHKWVELISNFVVVKNPKFCKMMNCTDLGYFFFRGGGGKELHITATSVLKNYSQSQDIFAANFLKLFNIHKCL